MFRLLHGLIPPKPMPDPDPKCRTYTFAEAVLLFRNHEQAIQQSKDLHTDKERK